MTRYAIRRNRRIHPSMYGGVGGRGREAPPTRFVVCQALAKAGWSTDDTNRSSVPQCLELDAETPVYFTRTCAWFEYDDTFAAVVLNACTRYTYVPLLAGLSVVVTTFGPVWPIRVKLLVPLGARSI